MAENPSEPKPAWLLVFAPAASDSNHACMVVFLFFSSEAALSTHFVVPSFPEVLLSDTKDIPLECQIE